MCGAEFGVNERERLTSIIIPVPHSRSHYEFLISILPEITSFKGSFYLRLTTL